MDPSLVGQAILQLGVASIIGIAWWAERQERIAMTKLVLDTFKQVQEDKAKDREVLRDIKRILNLKDADS